MSEQDNIPQAKTKVVIYFDNNHALSIMSPTLGNVLCDKYLKAKGELFAMQDIGNIWHVIDTAKVVTISFFPTENA